MFPCRIAYALRLLSKASKDVQFDREHLSKKGHINERAFSYSIRNEHRSRSHGSLLNAQQENTELPHMMSDLELSDERIERSEVPPGLFPGLRPSAGPPYGFGPPMMMMVPPEQIMMQQNGGRKKKR